MKKFLIIAGLMVSIMGFSKSIGSDDIVNALKQGDAIQFANFFDNILDVKLPEKDEIKNVGKTQASITMKSFFDDNGIKGFEKSSERELGGTMYLAGKLQGNNKVYNITIMMKNKGNAVSIITIRIN